jgi:phenol 2-monooxygenase
MPNPRALNSVLSADHGVVLWCPIDEGKTRIGYVFNKQLQEKYGASATVTPEIAVAEARKALAPFTVDFVKVDWCVKYGIGQRMASHFISNDRVILAGDACHTHSSGSAQGLNTGTHDAVGRVVFRDPLSAEPWQVNLAWKLALDLKGVSKPELLASYDTERRALVQTVIDNDVIVATLTSNQLPPKYAHRTESPRCVASIRLELIILTCAQGDLDRILRQRQDAGLYSRSRHRLSCVPYLGILRSWMMTRVQLRLVC